MGRLLSRFCNLVVVAVVCVAALITPAFAQGTDSSVPSSSQDLQSQQQTAAEATTGQAVQNQQTAQEPMPIYDSDGLFAMANNPYGSYKLMSDVDLDGRPWQPMEFHGTFDGGGHAILNAHVSGVGDSVRTTYDGNLKSYDTVFSGFFSVLEGATVHDVRFLGIDVEASTAQPTFVGGICGYMDDSRVEGCVVDGQVSLTTSGACIGVGGLLGFGRGMLARNIADVTLVLCDTDVVNKDEQFMGGAYADGYANLDGNSITLRGYDSDHGYVHNGGLVGMFILYPQDDGQMASFTNNHVAGYITFFEDNVDRRAYCDPSIGENMNMESITREGNTDDFTSDERFEYDVDLLPHACTNPTWSEEQVPSSCTEYGRTVRTCSNCGYSERVAWKPLEHQVSEWIESTDSSAQSLGLQQGTCTRCGATVFAKAPAGQSVATSENVEQETQAQEDHKGLPIVPMAIGAVALVLVGAVVFVLLARRR